jgi:hypothetical protein
MNTENKKRISIRGGMDADGTVLDRNEKRSLKWFGNIKGMGEE